MFVPIESTRLLLYNSERMIVCLATYLFVLHTLPLGLGVISIKVPFTENQAQLPYFKGSAIYLQIWVFGGRI